MSAPIDIEQTQTVLSEWHNEHTHPVTNDPHSVERCPLCGYVRRPCTIAEISGDALAALDVVLAENRALRERAVTLEAAGAGA